MPDTLQQVPDVIKPQLQIADIWEWKMKLGSQLLQLLSRFVGLVSAPQSSMGNVERNLLHYRSLLKRQRLSMCVILRFFSGPTMRKASPDPVHNRAPRSMWCTQAVYCSLPGNKQMANSPRCSPVLFTCGKSWLWSTSDNLQAYFSSADSSSNTTVDTEQRSETSVNESWVTNDNTPWVPIFWGFFWHNHLSLFWHYCIRFPN